MATVKTVQEIAGHVFGAKAVLSQSDELAKRFGKLGEFFAHDAALVAKLDNGFKDAVKSTDPNAIEAWRTEALREANSLTDVAKKTAAKDYLDGNTFKAGLQVLNDTKSFNDDIELSILAGVKVDLTALKKKYGFDAADVKDIVEPTLKRAERRLNVLEGYADELAKRTPGRSIDDARAEIGRNMANGKLQAEAKALAAGKDPSPFRTADTPAEREALAIKAAVRAVDNTGKAVESITLPSGVVLPKLETGTDWFAKFMKRSGNPLFFFTHWTKNLGSYLTDAKPLLNKINATTDAVLDKHGLVLNISRLEESMEAFAKRSHSSADRAAAYADVQKTLADFAKDNKAGLQAADKDLTALIMHLEAQLPNIALNKNKGGVHALLDVRDSKGMVVRSHTETVINGLKDLKARLADMQQPDFGELGERLRKAQNATDSETFQREISNGLNQIAEHIYGARLRLNPAGTAWEERQALVRAQEQSYYNPFSRAEKAGLKNVERTAYSLETWYMQWTKNKDGVGHIDWPVTAREDFAKLAYDIYKKGGDQEVLNSMTYLIMREGDKNRRVFPAGFMTELKTAGRGYPADKHYEHFVNQLEKRVNNADGEGATLYPGAAGREAARFWAEKTFIWRFARRFPGDGLIAKPAYITAMHNIIDPTMGHFYNWMGAKGYHPNTSLNTYKNVLPDWGTDAQGHALTWNSGEVWKRRLTTIPTLGVFGTGTWAPKRTALNIATFGLTTNAGLTVAGTGGMVMGTGMLLNEGTSWASDGKYSFDGGRLGRNIIEGEMRLSGWLTDNTFGRIPYVPSISATDAADLIFGDGKDTKGLVNYLLPIPSANAAPAPAGKASAPAGTPAPAPAPAPVLDATKTPVAATLAEVKTSAAAQLESANEVLAISRAALVKLAEQEQNAVKLMELAKTEKRTQDEAKYKKIQEQIATQIEAANTRQKDIEVNHALIKDRATQIGALTKDGELTVAQNLLNSQTAALNTMRDKTKAQDTALAAAQKAIQGGQELRVPAATTNNGGGTTTAPDRAPQTTEEKALDGIRNPKADGKPDVTQQYAARANAYLKGDTNPTGEAQKGIIEMFDDTKLQADKIRAFHEDRKLKGPVPDSLLLLVAQANVKQEAAANALKIAQDAQAEINKLNTQLLAIPTKGTTAEQVAQATALKKAMAEQTSIIISPDGKSGALVDARAANAALNKIIEENKFIDEFYRDKKIHDGGRAVATALSGDSQKTLLNRAFVGENGAPTLLDKFGKAASGTWDGLSGWWDKVGREAQKKGSNHQTAYQIANFGMIAIAGLTAFNMLSGIVKSTTGMDLGTGWTKWLAIAGIVAFAFNRDGKMAEKFDATETRNRERNLAQVGTGYATTHLPQGGLGPVTSKATGHTMPMPVNTAAATQPESGAVPGSNVTDISDYRMADASTGSGKHTARVPEATTVQVLRGTAATEAQTATFTGDRLVAQNDNQVKIAANAVS